MSKYTYELQYCDDGCDDGWRRAFFDNSYSGMKDRIAGADIMKMWYINDYRVVRKQGRKIVKVIYQTK